jgi:hypothetical protein
MKKEILEKIQARFTADADNQALFTAYDDMDNMRWTEPVGWTKIDEMRIRISTMAHDALKVATNIFDTYHPKWDVLPKTEAGFDDAEDLEAWLEWTAIRANQAGEFSPFRKGLHNSVKYNRVVYHVDYLPYWLDRNRDKWSDEQKENYAASPFCITAIDPRTCYYGMGKYGLRWFSAISNVSDVEILNNWKSYEGNTDDGKQIKSGLKLVEDAGKDEEVRFICVDYTDHERREVMVFQTGEEGISGVENLDVESGIVILSTKNKLGFIPFAVASGDSDPLLYSMNASGIWENQNIIDSVVDTSVLRRAFIPPFKHSSPTGKPLDIDFSGGQPTIELGPGETADAVNTPPLDPALREMMVINGQRGGSTVGIQNLGLMDIAGNVQFSTVQAQIQLQLTALQPYKRTAEKALVQTALLMFKWIKAADTSEVGYRTNVRSEGQFAGEGIMVEAQYLDPNSMIISCELLSNSPTDKQQLVNMYVTLKQAGAQVAWTELLERLGLGNPEQNKKMWLDEQLENAAMQNFVAEMQQAVQLKAQAAQMQMQSQMQMEQMQAQQMQNIPATDAINPEGANFDPNQGGQPPMMAEPGMTRNNVRNPA